MNYVVRLYTTILAGGSAIFLSACLQDAKLKLSTAEEEALKSDGIATTFTLSSPTVNTLSSNTAPIITGTYNTNGHLIYFYKDNTCIPQLSVIPSNVVNNAFTSVSLAYTPGGSDDGLKTIHYKTYDGTTYSACISTGLSYTLDTVAPGTPTSVTNIVPGTNPGNTLQPTMSIAGVDTTNTTTLSLHTDSLCTSTALASYNGGMTTTVNIPIINPLTEATNYTIYAKAIDNVGNSTCTSSFVNYTPDITPPVASSIGIFGSDVYTNTNPVNITLLATGGASDMYITNTAGCGSGGVWETYSTSKTGWTLGQLNQTATVYVRFKDLAGNISSCISDTIIHDNLPPSITVSSAPAYINIANNGSYGTVIGNCSEEGQTVSVKFNGVTQATAPCTGGSYSASGAFLTPMGDGPVTIAGYIADLAGNTTLSSGYSVTKDTAIPTVPTISIDAAAIYTTSTSVTLTLGATGASDMYVTNISGCATGGNWEALSSPKAWTLAQTNSTATVYVKYRDSAGNETGCINDTITHDNQMPGVSLSTTVNPTVKMAAIVVSITFTEPVTGFTIGDIGITNGTLSGFSGGGASYTVQAAPSSTTAQTNILIDVPASMANDNAGNPNTGATQLGIAFYPKPNVINGTADSNDPTPDILIGNGALGLTAHLYADAGCSIAKGFVGMAGATAIVTSSTVTSNVSTTFYAKFEDSGSNYSNCSVANFTYNHDNLPPGGESVSINSAAAYTTTDSVTLSLSATGGPFQMYITNTAGCSSGGTWESFNASKPWTLAQTNATATVYAKFKDLAGNETPCTSDTIIHDNQMPGVSLSTTINPTVKTSAIVVSITFTEPVTGFTIGDIGITNGTLSGFSGGGASYTVQAAPSSTTAQTNILIDVPASMANDNAGNPNTGATQLGIAFYPKPNVINGTADSNDPTPDILVGNGVLGLTANLYADAGCTIAMGSNAMAGATILVTSSTVTSNASTTFYANFSDSGSNYSLCSVASFTYNHDDMPPGSESVNIDSGATYATSTGVTLSLTATGGPFQMYITNTAGCSSGGSWEAFLGSKPWTLGLTNQTATVYAKFKDLAGNETSCTSDSIIHDDIPPSLTSTWTSTPTSPHDATTPSFSNDLSETGTVYLYYDGDTGCSSAISSAGNSTGGSFTTTITSPFAGEGYKNFKFRATDLAGNYTCAPVTFGSGYYLVTTPTLSSPPTRLFNSNYLLAGNTYTTNVNNTITGDDLYMSYTCSFDRVVDNTITGGLNCTSLPYGGFSAPTFNTSTGVLSWTVGYDAYGPYEIKIVGTRTAGGGLNNFVFTVLDVNPGVTMTNLIGYYDAMFSSTTGGSRDDVEGNRHQFIDLTSANLTNYSTITLADWATYGWAGSLPAVPQFERSNPHRIDLGSASARINFGSTYSTGTGNVTFDLWINRNASVPQLGKPILDNTSTNYGIQIIENPAKDGTIMAKHGTALNYLEYMTTSVGSPDIYSDIKFWAPLNERGLPGKVKVRQYSGGFTDAAYSGGIINPAGVTTDQDTTVTSGGKRSNERAYAFNSALSGYLDFGNTNLGLDASGYFAVCAWIKTSSASNQAIFASTNSGATSPGGSGSFYLGVKSTGELTLVTSCGTPTVSTGTVNNGLWHHVCGVSRSSATKTALFIDGVQDGTYTCTPSAYVTSNVTIGAAKNGGSPINYFNGQIDEVIVGNNTSGTSGATWSTTEITDIYNTRDNPYLVSRSHLDDSYWYHLAVLFNKTSNWMQLNFDGENQGSVGVLGGQYYSGGINNLVVANDQSSTNGWPGRIGELRIYDDAQTGTADNNFRMTSKKYESAPEKVGSLRAWYRSEVLYSYNNNDPVSLWDDSSANNIDLSQVLTGSKPILISNALNGRPVVRFDGTDDQLKNSSTNIVPNGSAAATVFIVGKRSDVNGSTLLGVNGDALSYYIDSGGIHKTFWATTSSYASSGSSPFNTPYITTINYNGGLGTDALKLKIFENGKELASSYFSSVPATLSTIAGFGLGSDYAGGSYLQGEIAEVVIFSVALTPQKQQQVEEYLSRKFSIPLSY